MPPFTNTSNLLSETVKSEPLVELDDVSDQSDTQSSEISHVNDNNNTLTSSNNKTKLKQLYHYIDNSDWSIVWTNVIFFCILHSAHFYGIYILSTLRPWATWIFTYIYASWGGLGVTAGAHRLWSHRSYEASLPLRIFLMLGHTIAGQNNLYVWSRDHRTHHKFSETDADPHNSHRGFFFAHMGWLLVKKHPEVLLKGKTLDCNDVLRDPVVRFQVRYYYLILLLWGVIIPWFIPVFFWDEKPWIAFFTAVVTRYVTSLHCTWFVNSTAHMFGYRPYNLKIGPRENIFVSWGAHGEGYHNYHHTFPWDYATSELGLSLNLTKFFIDAAAYFGLAYNLKRVPKHIIEKRKAQVEKVLAMDS